MRSVPEEFGHVEPDAAGADDRHTRTNHRIVPEHIDVTQHLGMVQAVDLRRAGRHTRGQDHFVEAQELFGSGFGGQSQIDSVQFQLTPIVAERLAELFLAGYAFGHVELAADFGSRFEQGHPVTALGGDAGKSQPRRSRADHGQRPGLRRRRIIQFGLAAGARVQQAGSDLPAEGVIQAGLVAGDAYVDFVGPARGGLVDEICVREQRARHRNHVGVAVGQDLLRYPGRIDPVGRDQGDADLALEFARDPGKPGPRHHRRDGRNAGFVPADAGVDQGRAGRFDRLRLRDDLVPAVAVGDQVEHRQAVDDDEVADRPRRGFGARSQPRSGSDWQRHHPTRRHAG